ncbi:MAG: alcohol dehydrogenase catalytic domain-containing protein [Rectinemataceae bacterium]
MPTMRAVQVSGPGGEFELVRREIPDPGAGEVLIKVEACGVCHGDAIVKEGHFPGLQYPRIPGHEVIGTIAALGSAVGGFRVGERVGVGWHGGHCHTCSSCRRGDFWGCENSLTTGISIDGGYAEYMAARSEVLIRIPDELESVAGAPLLCAGRTTYGALRNSKAQAGDLVAVQGLGGLGHLALQYAVKMGFRTFVVSRGREKEALAFRLGAHGYIDAEAGDPVKELKRLGGAKVILCTAPDAKAVSEIVGGLARGGQAVIVAAAGGMLQIPASLLIGGGRSIVGSGAGDIEDAINFSMLAKIVPMVETFPLERAAEAYDKMMKAKVRFRSVLKM